MANDDEVRIGTKLDTSGLDKGVTEMKNKLSNAGKQLDSGTKKNRSFAESLKGISSNALATAATTAGVAAAVKKTVDALNECAAAYRRQNNAEQALQIAAKNNPYLNDESVYNLKQYATQLQSLTETADEVSLQVMSQLAATGRTEDQIVQIMGAAADMAAVTGQDLASAAQQLNATLNGNAGTLGRQISSIDNLTKAELESGKAIEIVAGQYKGAAEATADTEVKLSNAWQSFKENIGKGWQQQTEPVKNFFLDILNNINAATAKMNELKEAKKTLSEIDTSENTEHTQEEYEQLAKAYAALITETTTAKEQAANKLAAAEESYNKKFSEITKNGTKKLSETESKYFEEVYGGAKEAALKDLNEIEAKLEELEEKRANAASSATALAGGGTGTGTSGSTLSKDDEDALKLIKDNKTALDAQIESIKLKAAVTKELGTAEKTESSAQEIYNAYLQSYIDLITNSNGLITENNSAAKEKLKLLKESAEALKAANTEEEKANKTEELKKQIKGVAASTTNNTIFTQYEKRNEELQKLNEELSENEILTQEEKDAAKLAIDEEYAQNEKELWKGITEEVNQYTQQAAQIAEDAANLMLKYVESEKDAELAELDEKYEKGEVSEEEYYAKQKEIKKKAAEDEYKIQMFQWHASILTATANIAQGISKAIAEGGVAGIISGTLVGAAGAVQLASIAASKPQPPSFAYGGIIGGANGVSMGSDNTYIHARNGEMVLNANQQRSLWDKLNGQGTAQQAGLNLIVNNTQANVIDTAISQKGDEIYIDILDKHINQSIGNGTYAAGFADMNVKKTGVRIL